MRYVTVVKVTKKKKHIAIGALICFQHPIGQSTATVETDALEQHTQLRSIATPGRRTNQRPWCMAHSEGRLIIRGGYTRMGSWGTYFIQEQN